MLTYVNFVMILYIWNCFTLKIMIKIQNVRKFLYGEIEKEIFECFFRLNFFFFSY